LPDWLALYYEDPLEITHGEGPYVWDSDGIKYLDFFGGILTTMTAHALPEVTKAVSEQAGRILHSSTLYLNRPMVELAERIAQLSGIPDARVFFTTSGTEANDTALLLATRPPAPLIAEPIQGVGGFTSGPDGLYAAFREVLAERGILWIADEVQTGWGRTGDNFWGWQAHGRSGPPDILTFAKGIGN